MVRTASGYPWNWSAPPLCTRYRRKIFLLHCNYKFHGWNCINSMNEIVRIYRWIMHLYWFNIGISQFSQVNEWQNSVELYTSLRGTCAHIIEQGGMSICMWKRRQRDISMLDKVGSDLCITLVFEYINPTHICTKLNICIHGDECAWTSHFRFLAAFLKVSGL